MKVIEKFVSINGEGLKSGELATFIRFAGCNLRCPYCDTKYSYENPKYEDLTVDELINYVVNANVKNVTLTGGEPLLVNGIDKLINELSKRGFRIEIETNGSVDIKPYVGIPGVVFTLDYKGPTSLMESKMNLDNYKYIGKNDVVKFVCGADLDLIKAKEIINKYKLNEISNPFISPMFGEIELEHIVNFMKDNNLNGVRLQIQIHKIIWNPNERGV